MPEHSEEKSVCGAALSGRTEAGTEGLRDRIAEAIERSDAMPVSRSRLSDLTLLYEHNADAVLAVLADADPTDLGMEASGVWYCRRHAGIANEDEHRGVCPLWEHADHCDAEHDVWLDDGACSPCQWVELLIPPAHPRTKETTDE